MIHENFSLKNYNTFGISAQAKVFFEYQLIEELEIFLKNMPIAASKYFVLGGGSNVLFTQDFEGIIIHPNNKGIECIYEDAKQVIVKVAAAEVWDDFVAWAVAHEYYGVENLSLIPGTVGASPVQNIGAYGVEVAQCIHRVHALRIDSAESFVFAKEECEFAYRSSVFKTKFAEQYIVTHVEFALYKQPQYHLEYGSLLQDVQAFGKLSLQNVRDAIIRVRTQKLPDPENLGNAGSFFKNPIISIEQLEHIKQLYPDIVFYPYDGANVKIAAGWMIDKLGFKGYAKGGVQVYEKQALVLVNTGNATGQNVVAISEEIQHAVFSKYGIVIEPEVVFL